MTSVFTYKFSQPMVPYGAGVTQGPRMLGGFLVQKYVIFMTKSTKQLTFHKKLFRSVFSYKM